LTVTRKGFMHLELVCRTGFMCYVAAEAWCFDTAAAAAATISPLDFHGNGCRFASMLKRPRPYPCEISGL
jgi:hypothetical protein